MGIFYFGPYEKSMQYIHDLHVGPMSLKTYKIRWHGSKGS